MTDEIKTPEIPVPSKEICTSYIKRINEDMLIEHRVKEICKKLNANFVETFHLDDSIAFKTTAYWHHEDKISFKILLPTNVVMTSCEMTTSCLWDDTDLHINLEMVKSDLQTDYAKYRSFVKKIQDEDMARSWWQKIKSWL